jgi:hypothetical protein
MIMTTIGLAMVALVVMVGVTAVSGDINPTGRDLQRKRAYEAAKAGINDYAFHLHWDNGYWAKCTNVAPPSAVNQQGSTTNRRQVPGDPNATYAIELLPAGGNTSCDPTTIITATNTMLESLGSAKGTFRIRSIGYAGKVEVPITATFRPASFLDYVYFTQLETSDPVTYGDEASIKGAYEQCSKTILEGRNSAKIPNSGGQYCRVISFVNGDSINGPLHTNDGLVVCGKPAFGRTPSDAIEVSSTPKGWYQTSEVPHSGSSCSGTPTFVGTYQTNSPALIPPATNSQLAKIAEPAFQYKGQVHICLNGTTMTVARKGVACDGEVLYSGAFPGNGVIYVESGLCSGAYSPFEVTYPETSECGNVYVHGSYSGRLTIASSNDIIIDGNTTKTSGEEPMLGLIANNFIRVYHPFQSVVIDKKTGATECQNATTGPVSNIEVDAAILAINHSFIVDNYDCGASLGTLTVRGAISQKYRGAVGTTGGTGYIKSYNYDDRLHTITPPSFLAPVQSDWVIGRETVG